MRPAALPIFEPAADLAFINGGTLRIDDIIDGDIRFEDIGRTFGFSSFLRHTTVTGTEFKQVMEAGYRGLGGTQGYFPQVSGFRVCVDRSRNEGDRIVSLQVPADNGWSEIEADEARRWADGWWIILDRSELHISGEYDFA